ncbi:acetyl-CoA carboxylase biotin carboxyl carrier protein [Ligilactobacillus ceti]|uniref:Biotin carboxyl carrier protein of acetyl-CoA carboxylase n=1 Tax=Ligilactobacillus ceti DSM 22408 TaxID=1122146 RepID=A0A0R2KIC9_9LACO|nr:biotin/lipoyl-containing protein [Ligilactobacillus ceti]KRN89041.1 hypothetical protein IV53_GL001014 [Ligilactobacillus ceti DSM 22408]
MDFQEIQKIIEDFTNSEIRELDLQIDDFKLYLNKNETSRLTDSKQQENIENNQLCEETAKANYIKAPMVGSIYLQPEPTAAPFVEVGTFVKENDVVCIIEAMKVMTEIRSTKSGVITQILVSDEELVEYDQPLFKIDQMIE